MPTRAGAWLTAHLIATFLAAMLDFRCFARFKIKLYRLGSRRVAVPPSPALRKNQRVPIRALNASNEQRFAAHSVKPLLQVARPLMDRDRVF
jgi:hypothetical protein